ncbi:hypothetical protein OBBRIDRAFT_791995 [Obba rivulosa]|uniref:Uncharacterized protein n=1 Tax=Obba rivulosa TaxID=1052685 RepID=A0A8E2DKR1_9APHY|nr:hypothetical protein OBBRIDRAFT_791995 [Obba rivulosa]
MIAFWWTVGPFASHGVAQADGIKDCVYFHQLPASAYGDVPSPFGYWSLDSEPTAGPWPELPLTGVSVDCRSATLLINTACKQFSQQYVHRASFASLNSLQAGLLTSFHQQVKAKVAQPGARGTQRYRRFS